MMLRSGTHHASPPPGLSHTAGHQSYQVSTVRTTSPDMDMIDPVLRASRNTSDHLSEPREPNRFLALSSAANYLPPPYAPLSSSGSSPHPPPTPYSLYSDPQPLLEGGVTTRIDRQDGLAARNGWISPAQRAPTVVYPSSSGSDYRNGTMLKTPPMNGHHDGHDENRRASISLPSMNSWAPQVPPRQSPHQSPGRNYHRSPSSSWSNPPPMRIPDAADFDHRAAKRSRVTDRRPSDVEEVEAGLALAGMGLAMSPKQSISSRRESLTKKADSNRKKGEKDGRKSCAECRRLKAKCDRVFPCSNCRRRGCALVCPDGDLSCMQGKRLVLASTEQLHERIAQLESALLQSHSKTSSGHHPLLAPEYLDGGFAALSPPDVKTKIHSPNVSPRDTKSSLFPDTRTGSPHERQSESAGSGTPNLAPKDRSISRMAVESLLLNEDATAAEGKSQDEWMGENAAPAMIVGSHPDKADDGSEKHRIVERLRSILRILPSREVTRRRAAHFFDFSRWYNVLLWESEFREIYEPAVYEPTAANPLSPHKLAVVLMVLTLDMYFDLSAEEDSSDVGAYWDAVQRCFDTRFGWAASIAGCQALGLATLFVGFGWRGAKTTNLYWLRQMTSAAQQLGLHKEPHPALSEKEREFRRRVAHEINAIDCLICLNHGQRVAVPSEDIECRFPSKDMSPVQLQKWEFLRFLSSAVLDVGCRPDSRPASWDQVKLIDDKLSVMGIEQHPEFHCRALRADPDPEPSNDPSVVNIDDLVLCMTSHCIYKSFLFLHRPGLRRLIARLRHTNADDIITLDDHERMTISRSWQACHCLIQTASYVSRNYPRLAARTWSTWVHAFSAAVSMAAMALWCSPYLEGTFCQAAYKEVSEACEMIRRSGSKRSQGVLDLLPILQSLVSGRYPHVIGRHPTTARVSEEGENMVFALLGGEVTSRPSSRSSQNASSRNGEKLDDSKTGAVAKEAEELDPPFDPNPAPHMENSSSDLGIDGSDHFMGLTNGIPNGLMGPEHYANSLPDSQLPSTNPYIAETQARAAAANNSMGRHGHLQPLPTAMPMIDSHAQPMPMLDFAYGPGLHSNSQSMDSSNGAIGHSLSGEGISSQHPGPGQGVQPLEMSNNELWARLQTFYEPTPAFWEHQNGAYVDFAGMMTGQQRKEVPS